MPIEKEIITTENIINDYKKIFLSTIKKLIILLSFMLPLSILFVYLSVISTKELKITFTIAGFVFLSVLCVIFELLMVKYKNFKFITKQNFKIEVGTLAEKKELSLGRPCLPSEVNVLTFGKYSCLKAYIILLANNSLCAKMKFSVLQKSGTNFI